MSYGPPPFADDPNQNVPPMAASGKATASLVLGILSFLTCLLTGIPAVILGILALGDIGRSRGRTRGHGAAVAGIITGSLGILGTGALIAIMFPAMTNVMEAVKRTNSQRNLAEISRDMIVYQATHGTFPSDSHDAGGKPLLSWRVHILRDIGEAALYEQFHLDEPWDSPHNRTLIAKMPRIYRSPGHEDLPEDGQTCYLRPKGKETLFTGQRGDRVGAGAKDVPIPDGAHATLLLVEADSDRAVQWTRPEDLPIDLSRPKAGLGHLRSDGFCVAYADGHAVFLENTIKDDELARQFTPDGKRWGQNR